MLERMFMTVRIGVLLTRCIIVASKLYGVDATIIIFVFVLYCIFCLLLRRKDVDRTGVLWEKVVVENYFNYQKSILSDQKQK